MFRFQPGRTYQMPVHFGPCCGPRSGPLGERFFADGPQTSIQHSLVYETSPQLLENYLPEGFSLRSPHVIVTHKMHRDLPWLAGRGYNVVTFNTPVTYRGQKETITGRYQLAIWENHADPILCGREQLGYSKLYAEIEDLHTFREWSSAQLSSWGFPFLELRFRRQQPPAGEDALLPFVSDPEDQGLLHYKYIPHTGDGFSAADTAYVTLSPSGFVPPEGLPPLPPPERHWCTGSLSWQIPSWEDMPTQYHVVQGLAALPILRVLGGWSITLQHYNDVYDQRPVR